MLAASKRALVVGGLSFWLPTNREPGANPERPRRCDRAQSAKHSVSAITSIEDFLVTEVTRPSVESG